MRLNKLSSLKKDSLPSVFVNSEPIREDQIQNAIKFLTHPRVKGSSVIHRRSFLVSKGLTNEEIEEAFRRVPDPPPSSQTIVNSQDGQQAVYVQPQGQIQAMIPPPSFLSRFRWYHTAITIGVLAASCAGAAVFVKKCLIPRLKLWIRRNVLEEGTDPLEKRSLVEEAVTAAKAASDVARVSQELIKRKTEEMKYLEDLKYMLSLQVQEMKSLSNNIRKLEGQSNYLPKVYGGSSTILNTAAKPFTKGSNRSQDIDFPRVPPVDSYMPTRPFSDMDERNDMPPNPYHQLSNHQIAPNTKPWNYGQAQQDKSFNSSWWQQKNPRSKDFVHETTPMRGNQNETSTMVPAAFQRQSSWVPPQSPPVVMPEAAIAIRLPKPQPKIDQNSFPNVDQSGVNNEPGATGSGRLQITEIQEETKPQHIFNQAVA